ncbi:50S ribosomal protein L3 [Candidatus Tiddalikarchaeum anstoanum]|nr:50S ribosomal protein L3 [Candidatus Tiddalikarchaeum anstoanum]
MGHVIGDVGAPRRGSMQFWPRSRAKRSYPRLTNSPKLKEPVLSSFSGYKVGMTHIMVIDNLKNSPTKGQEIVVPVTIIECPPINVFAIRLYQETTIGLKIIGQINSESYEKVLANKLSVKNAEHKKSLTLEEAMKLSDKIAKVNLIIHTHPEMTAIGKKKPEVMEIPMGGDVKSALTKSFEILGKQVNVGDVFKEGEQLDMFSVTTGKGFQGSVKRYGVKIAPHKTEFIKRKAMNIGLHSPKKVTHNPPQFGQMGYQTRVEYNKWLLKIEDPEKINVKGGYVKFGFPKNKVILVKGSIPGPKKRLIRIRKSIRPNKLIPAQPPQITYVSTTSKQG